MTPEQKFIAAVNVARSFHVRADKFADERREFFAELRADHIDSKLVKEIAKRYESKDPLGFSEFDDKLKEAIEIYAKSEMAQNLQRVHVHEKTKSPIASTISPSPQIRGNGSQATAADSATDLPGDLSAATNSDTAAKPGETPAAVPAPPAKADDAIVVRTQKPLAPVFARYKNGAHA